MSNINQDLQNLGIDISNLDLNIDTSQFDDMFDPSNMHIYQSKTNTTRLAVGETVSYSVNIRGRVLPAFLTLRSAKLTHLNVKNGSNLNNPYKIIGGTLSPVQMDIEVLADGERVNFIDFLLATAKATSSAESLQNIDRATWIEYLDKMGIKFPKGAPLFFKQWGGNMDSYNEFLETLRSKGITLVENNKGVGTMSNGKISNIQEAWEIKTVTGMNGSKPGLDVIEFEVSASDRTATKLYKNSNGQLQQGFVDFGDSIFESFMKVVELRKKVAIMKKLIETNIDTLKQGDVNRINEQIAITEKMSNQYTAHLGGAHQIYQEQKNGTFIPTNAYGADEVDCGRLSFLINDEITKVSFWSDKRVANNAESGVTNQAVTASDLSKIAGFANS